MPAKYTPKPETLARLETNFTHHPPHGDQGQRYGHIRGVLKEVAKELCQNCPESRELSLALTHLEEVCFWANASIARVEAEVVPSVPPKA